MVEEIAMCVNHNARGVWGISNCLSMGSMLESWFRATGYSNDPMPPFAEWLEANLSAVERSFQELVLDIFAKIKIPDWDAIRKRQDEVQERLKRSIKINIFRGL